MISRERIYAMLANEDENDKLATVYNLAMVFLIVLWMVPLWFKEENTAFVVIDYACTGIFMVDYLLRWITADFKLNRGKVSFAMYPFTPMAILDLLAFMPTFLSANASLKAIRLIRVLGALRAFKLIRHSKSIRLLLEAARNQRMPLLVSFALATIYVFASATVMFNVEPFLFNNFLDALYWSVISLTTIGYGDIHPVTELGRFVAMISAFVGVAIIAFPSGVIAAGLINELNKRNWYEMVERLVGKKEAERLIGKGESEQLPGKGEAGQPAAKDEAGKSD